MSGTNDRQPSLKIDGTRPPSVLAKPGVAPVVEYVRMSTDLQQYSIENQQRAIRDFAQRHGMIVVRTYADAAKSGLRIERREALKQLIADVQAGLADFAAILVYDVSRWGRFQDVDESAFYEHICRRAKIAVHYCAEQFENDGSPMATIIKTVKRAMAGEYSRELSTKVFIGQCRLAELGYYRGGLPGFGLRRMLVDAQGEYKGLLKLGEKKSIQTDRVILVPGPPDEVGIVREIFRDFVKNRLSASAIVRRLNRNGIRTYLGNPWEWMSLKGLLTNERYIGNNVYNRTSQKLGRKQVKNPPEKWVRKESAFESIVSRDAFARAQAIIQAGWGGAEYSKKEILDGLRRLLQRKGKLTHSLIDADEYLPSSDYIAARFGSIIRAYELAGFTPLTFFHYKETNSKRGALRLRIIHEITEGIHKLGGLVKHDPSADLLTVNDEFTALLVLALFRRNADGRGHWVVGCRPRPTADITVVVRMGRDNRSVLDYYLLPKGAATLKGQVLSEYRCVRLKAFRFVNLEPLYALTRRTRISEEA